MTASSTSSGWAASRTRLWLQSRPDGTLLQWLFRTILAATVVVLGLDLVELSSASYRETPALEPLGEPVTHHYLPSVREGLPGPRERSPRAPQDEFSTATFELTTEGRLLLTGAIDPGAADRFAEEVAKRGEYIKTVVLFSPGGSVDDALRIGRLIRDRGFHTEVEAGSYCASSCPLIFAAGLERVAGEGAAIGVHQVTTSPAVGISPNRGMESAQRASAECQRYLLEMGVDPRVWIHAMETPPAELFYFTTDELVELGLATSVAEL